MCISVYNHPQKVEPQAKRGVMYAVVVISIMFGAVIVMVKKADKEMTTFSGRRVEWYRTLLPVPEV